MKRWTQSRSSRNRTLVAATLALTLLAACGGGGGSASSESPAQASSADPLSTAIGDFQTNGQVPQNFRAESDMPADVIAAAAAALPADSGPTYLKVWVVDAATGEPQTLSLGRYEAGQSLPQVQPPLTVTKVMFEVYNAVASTTGEWSLT
jgi:hypothetical protein